MKKILLSACFPALAAVSLNAQLLNKQNSSKSTKKFSLTITTYNHSEAFMHGISSYVIAHKYLKVYNKPLLGKEESIVFSKPVSRLVKSIIYFANKKLDSLKDVYVNVCIMFTSGTEFNISFKNLSYTKNIYLHHYYLKEIEDLINLINKSLPKEYKIHYLSKSTKQDCTL